MGGGGAEDHSVCERIGEAKQYLRELGPIDFERRRDARPERWLETESPILDRAPWRMPPVVAVDQVQQPPLGQPWCEAQVTKVGTDRLPVSAFEVVEDLGAGHR
jgi:hypothetical protein